MRAESITEQQSLLRLSVIVPVYNGAEMIERTLAALRDSMPDSWELMVVDDGSSDDSRGAALRHGVTLLSTGAPRSGPAAARNRGAIAATGEILCFIDADCVIHEETLARIAAHFTGEDPCDAVFGAYGEAPTATNFVAQYKNLTHGFIHRDAESNASTFWAGCGAVRRSRFLQLGGFDAVRFPRPSVEDIEFGMRLKRAGGTIHLDGSIVVEHQKAWTLAGLVRTDVLQRAIPWTRLMLAEGSIPNDLNMKMHHRLSAAALIAAAGAVLLSPFFPPVLLLLPASIVALLWLNRGLYSFLADQRGSLFLLRAIPMHWLYYLCSIIGFAAGCALHLVDRLRPEAKRALPPLPEQRS